MLIKKQILKNKWIFIGAGAGAGVGAGEKNTRSQSRSKTDRPCNTVRNSGTLYFTSTRAARLPAAVVRVGCCPKKRIAALHAVHRLNVPEVL